MKKEIKDLQDIHRTIVSQEGYDISIWEYEVGLSWKCFDVFIGGSPMALLVERYEELTRYALKFRNETLNKNAIIKSREDALQSLSCGSSIINPLSIFYRGEEVALVMENIKGVFSFIDVFESKKSAEIFIDRLHMVNANHNCKFHFTCSERFLKNNRI